MKPREIFTGNWGVETDNGSLIVSGLRTNAEAWNWIDRHTDQGRDDDERHMRIGVAVGHQ